MTKSGLRIDRPLAAPQVSEAYSKSTKSPGHILIALGIIAAIGSLITASCLYPHIGYWSFAVAGSGFIIGLGLILIGFRLRHYNHSKVESKSPQDSFNPEMIETKQKKSDTLIQKTKVLTCADDIILPDVLPTNINNKWNILGKVWLSNNQLHYYITYLGTKHPELACHYFPESYTIDSIDNSIFNRLPAAVPNYNDLNVPINLLVTNNHWTLVYIDREKRTVEYYDSKKNYGNYDEIITKLTDIAHSLSKQEPTKPPYQFVNKINKTLQPDAHQCGVWLLYFLENRLNDPHFDFNQLDRQTASPMIEKFRTKVMLKLIEMDEILCTTVAKEKAAYKEYYKEEEFLKMYRTDLRKLSFIERWRQILAGQSLVPSKKPMDRSIL